MSTTDPNLANAVVPNTGTQGSRATATVAAAASAVAIKASSGRLHKVLVTTTGSAAVNFYDSANAASGTIIGTIPANAAAGTVYDFDMPAANGIYYAGGANTPALTISFD